MLRNLIAADVASIYEINKEALGMLLVQMKRLVN